jgi:ADP-ribose diphosphatase
MQPTGECGRQIARPHDADGRLRHLLSFKGRPGHLQVRSLETESNSRSLAYIEPMAKNAKRQRARVLASRVVFRGPVFYVTSDRIQEPSGVEARRDMVRHPGSVVIMGVDDTRRELRVLLARQYRYAAGDLLWELPAGRIDPGEDEFQAARREFVEETGYSASEWHRALFFYSSPGFLDETMAVYVARGLRRGRARPEEDEVITRRFFPITEALRMIDRGAIRDGKTIAGVLWLKEQLTRKPRP